MKEKKIDNGEEGVCWWFGSEEESEREDKRRVKKNEKRKKSMGSNEIKNDRDKPS